MKNFLKGFKPKDYTEGFYFSVKSCMGGEYGLKLYINKDRAELAIELLGELMQGKNKYILSYKLPNEWEGFCVHCYSYKIIAPEKYVTKSKELL